MAEFRNRLQTGRSPHTRSAVRPFTHTTQCRSSETKTRRRKAEMAVPYCLILHGGRDSVTGKIRSCLEDLRTRPLRAARRASSAATVVMGSATHEGSSDFSGSSFSLSTIRQSSASDAALTFRIMLLRCTFTVVSVMPISKAICLFSLPSAT